MMQKNTSNLVLKTVRELNIRVKSYHEKSAWKNYLFTLSLYFPLFLLAGHPL